MASLCQEFGEDLSSAAGAAASRLGSNFMGVAASLKAGIQFRKAEAAAALGEPHDGDGNDEHHPEAVLEVGFLIMRSSSR